VALVSSFGVSQTLGMTDGGASLAQHQSNPFGFIPDADSNSAYAIYVDVDWPVLVVLSVAAACVFIYLRWLRSRA
jgi:hypothetical protein